MTDAIVISDRYRTPTTASRRDNGGVMLRQGHRFVVLEAAEFERVAEFVRDEPELGKLARFAVVAPQSPPTATESDD
jgi:hypothetical protein